MNNQSLNRVVYHYVLPVYDGNGLLIDLQDIKILNAHDYQTLREEAQKGLAEHRKLIEEQQAVEEAERAHRSREAATAKAEEVRLQELEAYHRRYSFSKFLNAYNYLKIKSFEGGTQMTGAELDELLSKVTSKDLTVEQAVGKYSEFKEIFDLLEVD